VLCDSFPQSTMWPFDNSTISEGDLRDLHGKVVIITGGYSGIGYSTTQFLARKGAKVYLATRNEEGTKEAMEMLKNEGLGDGTLHWLKLDLSDPRGVKSSAEEFMKKEDRLDILINNAAKGNGATSLTADGLRDMMVINYLSHFVFTETLLPLLVRTSKEENSDVRIISVSSEAHGRVQPTSFVGRENFNKEYGDSFMNELCTYGLSKLAIVLHIKHLQRRLNAQDAPIICMTLHPGVVMTPLVTRSANEKPLIFRLFLKFIAHTLFTSTRKGAMNSAYTAASPEVRAKAESFKGAFLYPIGVITDASPQARDERLMDELYATTLDILKELGV